MAGNKTGSGKMINVKNINLTVAFSVLFIANFISAQEQQGIPMTLSQALSKALVQNLDLREYANQLKSGNINYSQSKGNMLPDLSASVSVSRRYNREYDQYTGRTTGNESQGVSAGIQSGINLFNGFSDISSIRKAKSELESDRFSFQRLKEEILYQTILLFMQVVKDSELVTIEKENLAAQKNQLDLILEFHKAGNRSVADVLQQRADIAQAELRLLSARHTYELSRLNLLEILGEQPGMNYSLIIPPDDFFKKESSYPDTIQFFPVEYRADWKAMEWNLSAAKQDINIASSGYWPLLGLNLSAGSSYSNDRDGLSFSDQFSDVNPYVSAGLSLSLPIFDRFRTRNNVQIARIQVENIRLQQEKLKLSINLNERQAKLNYETSIKQKESAKAKLDYARQALEVTEARYKVGSATYVELSQLRANRLSAATEYIQAVYDVMLKMFALQHQQGRLEETLVDLNLLENE
jgi:outer membrane protein